VCSSDLFIFIFVFCFWILTFIFVLVILAILRVSELDHSPLFSLFFRLVADFIGALASQWLVTLIFIVWTWQTIHCQHREQFTICFCAVV
jgi:hypothetical protein